MKIIKNILVAFLSMILVGCIFLLAISFNLKKILINGVIKETFVEQIIPKSYNEERVVITEEQIREITDDPRIQEMLMSPEIQGLMEQYLDTTVNGLIDENNIDDIALEQDMLKFIKENRSVIEEKAGKEITDDMIEKAMEQVESKDMSRAYKQSIMNASRNMSSTEKEMLKGYRFLISPELRMIILVVIIIDLVLIMVVQASLYKWIATLAVSLLISGVGTIAASIITKGIIRKKTNFDNFDMSSLTQTGIIIALSGLVILTVYIVILKLIKKKVKVGKHEISEFSEKE
jgi:hypothetical protein